MDFEDWFIEIQLKRAGAGFQKAFSFSETLHQDLNNTVFLTGLPGSTYLIGETNRTHPETDPRVPGKQQSMLLFNMIDTGHVSERDVSPSRLIFNGEECALPKSDARRYPANFKLVAFIMWPSGRQFFLCDQMVDPALY
ncbi:COBRA-like protein 10 [Sesamum alatum]|uniref:COBRA-like protein 10 n=1 Tax=Sesamum alatum TaxID=300844 RepID=A0AAE1Z047_9LAMI|nr:COBRA-like protein 10 [Sesamum alatum]